jgi:hypothetical protein
MRRTSWLWLFVAGFSGCPKSELPPGLPPPEYERPVVPPWPAAAEAGAAVEEPDAAPPGAAPADAGTAFDAGSSEAAVDAAILPAH